jgi:DNA-binding FrmR family transcriptional regulator
MLWLRCIWLDELRFERKNQWYTATTFRIRRFDGAYTSMGYRMMKAGLLPLEGSRHQMNRLGVYTIGGYSSRKTPMHTVEEKPKLILRIRRIKGQIAAIERALENDEDCSNVLQLITAARGAMNGLMAELVEGHIRFHVLDPKQKRSSEQALAADELVEIVRSYLK